MNSVANPQSEPDFNKILNVALGALFKDRVKVACACTYGPTAMIAAPMMMVCPKVRPNTTSALPRNINFCFYL